MTLLNALKKPGVISVTPACEKSSIVKRSGFFTIYTEESRLPIEVHSFRVVAVQEHFCAQRSMTLVAKQMRWKGKEHRTSNVNPMGIKLGHTLFILMYEASHSSLYSVV